MSRPIPLTDAEAARIYGQMASVPGAPGCRRFGLPPRSLTDPQCLFRGKMRPVLRILWEAVHGTAPEGRLVRRGCATKGCCTIAHARVLSQTRRSSARRVALTG